MKPKSVLWAATLLCLAATVMAAATFNSPTDNSRIYGSVLFNVTPSITNTTNCSVSGSSALTGDTWAAFYMYNSSGFGKHLNVTNETSTEMIDASDWTFTGTCTNYTGGTETITAVTGITIDNHKPTCAHSGIVSGGEYAYDRTWTVTAVNATACTLFLGGESSGNSYTMTESSDSCTYAGRLPTHSSVTVGAQTSDGTNTTTCAAVDYVQIIGDSSKEIVAAATAAASTAKLAQAESPGRNKYAPLAGLVLLGLALYMYSQRSGKGRKR